MADSSQRFSWEALSHEHTERSNDWYWALGVLVLAGATIAVLLNNPLFAVIILLGGFSLGMLASRPSKTYRIEIDSRGITIDENLYLFRSLDSFWVDDETREHVPHLIVASRGLLTPQLILPLIDVDGEQVRDFLIKYLEEKEQYESPLTRVAELFGF